jgi:hypothetical protein
MKKTKIYLIALVVMMTASLGLRAQNTGTHAYANSTHVYTTTKSSMPSTTLLWAVSGGGAFQGAQNGTSATIVWGNVPGNYTVTVTESTTNGCSTKREIAVTVVANAFNLLVADLTDDCGAGSNTILPVSANPPPTTRVFTVNMVGDLTKPFTFNYAITSPVSSATINSVSVKDKDGLEIATGASGTAVNVAAGKAPLTFTIVVASKWDAQDDLKLTISNAKDSFGTPENELVADNSDTAIIFGIPNTTTITTDN